MNIGHSLAHFSNLLLLAFLLYRRLSRATHLHHFAATRVEQEGNKNSDGHNWTVGGRVYCVDQHGFGGNHVEMKDALKMHLAVMDW